MARELDGSLNRAMNRAREESKPAERKAIPFDRGITPVDPPPTGDVRRYHCRNAGCDWTGLRRNMNQVARNQGSGGRIIGLHCPKCARWIRDA